MVGSGWAGRKKEEKAFAHYISEKYLPKSIFFFKYPFFGHKPYNIFLRKITPDTRHVETRIVGSGWAGRKQFSKHRPSGPMLSISWNVHISVCLSVCLFVCVFTFEVPFNGLFAPTSRSWMSNIFRDSESLGKSNGKKWSHIWTFLFGSGLKSPLILPYKTWWKPRFPMDSKHSRTVLCSLAQFPYHGRVRKPGKSSKVSCKNYSRWRI